MTFDKLFIRGIEGELVGLVVKVEGLLVFNWTTQPRQVKMFVGRSEERGETRGNPSPCGDQQSQLHHQGSHFCFVYLIVQYHNMNRY